MCVPVCTFLTEEAMRRVCIIGAGASGLCAARQLSALDPPPEFVVYEQSREVGGVWVYRDEAGVDQDGYTVQGRMYKNMRCAQASMHPLHC